VRCAHADVLKREGEVASLDFGVVTGYKLLDHLMGSILELFVGLGHHFLDLLEVVHADVLIAVGLEDFARNFATLEALGMDKVAKFAACAPVGAVVVSTGHRAEVARLDDLVHLIDGLLRRKLVNLSHVGFALLVDFLVLGNRFVCHVDKYAGWLTRGFHQQTADALVLL